MTPYQAYTEYVALKNHFTQKKYDYVKYNGKLKSTSQKTFEARNDKYLFAKLAKKKDVRGFLISNFIEYGAKKWIGELINNEEADRIYNEWLKRNQSLSYVFKTELEYLNRDFNSNFLCNDDSHPKLLKLYLSKKISLETLLILCDLTECIKMWNVKMASDLVWAEVEMKLTKYSCFFKYDREKIRKIVIDMFSER